MTENDVLKILEKTKAFLRGHFKLSSGLHSAQYLQCALLLQNPQFSEKMCKALAGKFKDAKPDIVIAPALGGVLVSYEVARAMGVKSLFTERVDGKMTLRRNFSLNKKDKVLVVEDVVTTGRSTREVIELVKSFGSEIIGVGCLVDRSKGKVDFGTRFESLLKLDVPTFQPESCPLCKEKNPLTKPGSRK